MSSCTRSLSHRAWLCRCTHPDLHGLGRCRVWQALEALEELQRRQEEEKAMAKLVDPEVSGHS